MIHFQMQTTEPPNHASESSPSGGKVLFATDELFTLVYQEMHRLARFWFQGCSADQTLQPTALVHEAYIKLMSGSEKRFNDRTHFCAVASRAMRQIVIDRARSRRAEKRAGDRKRVFFDCAEAVSTRRGIELHSLNEALEKLFLLDPRRGRVVEMRLFGGLSNSAIAVVLDISRVTVDHDWQVARAWLRAEIKDDTE